MKKKILVIAGPTATGKTPLALKDAKRFKGELISADSRQIYRGMDIGTGKVPLPKLKIKNEKLKIVKGNGYWIQEGVKIWGYDLVEPDEIFTAYDFAKFAQEKIKGIQSRGKLPILVGGTGFWIEMALGKVALAQVPPDWKLRKQLEDYPAEVLFEKLKSLDPKRAESIDPKNKRRLIRAIEIAISNPSSTFPARIAMRSVAGGYPQTPPSTPQPLPSKIVLLTAPRQILYQRIDQRVDQMIAVGLINEIKGLLKRGYSWDLPSMSGIGYRQFKPFIEGTKTLEECVQKLKFDTHAYARRQLTYFRRFNGAKVVDVARESLVEFAAQISKF